jgi:uncharacterized protein YkwD/uncharacterized membrane protein required for colicin V production
MHLIYVFMETIFNYLTSFVYIDFFISVVVIYNLYLGWKSGYVKQILNLVFLSISIYSTFKYSYSFGSYLSNWFNSDIVLSEIFAGILIFTTSITLFSIILNLFNLKKPDYELGNRFLGSFVSIFVSNLALTIFFSSIALINLPNFLKEEIEVSDLSQFYINVDGTPQQFLELISGTDILKVSQRIKELTGSSTVVVNDFGCVDIPKYSMQLINYDLELNSALLQITNDERSMNNVQPLEYNQRMSNVAKDYAFEMYTKGFWCHKNPNTGELVRDRLDNAGIPFQIIGENLAIAPTLQSAHRSLMQSDSHREAILDFEFKRVGIAVVSGPLGLIIVQIFSS